MSVFILKKLQMGKINNVEIIESPTNDKYLKETEQSNLILRQKLKKYNEACKNAVNIYVY